MNPPSSWAVAVRDAPQIGAQLWTHGMPAGPNGRYAPFLPYFWGIWNFSKNKSAAKSLIMALCQPEAIAKLVEGLADVMLMNSGEANMSHSIANLEYHHFKYDGFRRPGDLHIHYFGTATLSIADGVKTEDGDIFEITAAPFGAALRNPLKAVKAAYRPGSVRAL